MDFKHDVLFHRNLPFRFAPFAGASGFFWVECITSGQIEWQPRTTWALKR